jgi:hypothetical protein
MEGAPWAVDGRRLLALGRNALAFFSLTQANRGAATEKLCVELVVFSQQNQTEQRQTKQSDLLDQLNAGCLSFVFGTNRSFRRFACARLETSSVDSGFDSF